MKDIILMLLTLVGLMVGGCLLAETSHRKTMNQRLAFLCFSMFLNCVGAAAMLLLYLERGK